MKFLVNLECVTWCNLFDKPKLGRFNHHQNGKPTAAPLDWSKKNWGKVSPPSHGTTGMSPQVEDAGIDSRSHSWSSLVGEPDHGKMFFFRQLTLTDMKWTYLVGGDWNVNFMTFHILGFSSSQLTNSYFSEVLKPPTRYVLCEFMFMNRMMNND